MIYGDHDRFLAYDPIEHPLALQLGSSDPRELADCARIAKEYGYDEVNLNVGCRDRVEEGQFGACLMAEPDLVARCVEAMRGCKCSGSITVGVGLANGGWFGLTLCDKGLDGRLMLGDNRLRLADNGLDNGAPGSRLLTIDDSYLRMSQCPQPARSRRSSRWLRLSCRPAPGVFF